MRFPFKIYKHSQKATLISAAGALACFALILAPIVLVGLHGRVTPVLAVVFILCIIASIAVRSWSDGCSDRIAEADTCRYLGKECLRSR